MTPPMDGSRQICTSTKPLLRKTSATPGPMATAGTCRTSDSHGSVTLWQKPATADGLANTHAPILPDCTMAKSVVSGVVTIWVSYTDRAVTMPPRRLSAVSNSPDASVVRGSRIRAPCTFGSSCASVALSDFVGWKYTGNRAPAATRLVCAPTTATRGPTGGHGAPASTTAS